MSHYLRTWKKTSAWLLLEAQKLTRSTHIISLNIHVIKELVALFSDKVPNEQAKAEEIHSFTEIYMDWKGVNNHSLGHIPRIYDRVGTCILETCK